MGNLPNLTKDQLKSLAVLEPKLKLCVKSADFEKAKKITQEIHAILKPTGHETRLLQAKNWLYETAMEAHHTAYAISGFSGTIKKSAEGTRLQLEATSLLAICYLREKNINLARPLIIKAVNNINKIKSTERREQFHRRLIQRLEEESILIGLRDESGSPLDVLTVDKEAVELIKTKDENQILIEMGKAVPESSIELLSDVRNTYQLKLPKPDIKLLPPPLTKEKELELGKRASSALRRVAWRAICSPESEIYKAWTQGLSVVYDKKYIAGAIVTAFGNISISTTMIAASAVALAIKFGAEVFCETFAPAGMMIDRKDKK